MQTVGGPAGITKIIICVCSHKERRLCFHSFNLKIGKADNIHIFLVEKNNNFLWLSLGQVGTSTAGRVYDLCVLSYDGSIRRLTESSFMEQPGIKPTTPGLQGIADGGYIPPRIHVQDNFVMLF